MTEQRSLKFRAWDPESRMMLDEWILTQDYSYTVPGDTVELGQLTQLYGMHVMQFTGFYDRSGREIYEGDVLLSREADTGLEDELFEMFYELGGFCLVDFPRSTISEGYVCYRNWYNAASRGGGRDTPQPSCRFDVVGHIHEPLERIEQRVMELQNSGGQEGNPSGPKLTAIQAELVNELVRADAGLDEDGDDWGEDQEPEVWSEDEN